LIFSITLLVFDEELVDHFLAVISQIDKFEHLNTALIALAEFIIFFDFAAF